MTKTPAIILGLTRGIELIADALLRRYDADLIVLYDHAADALEREGMPCVRLTSYHTAESLERADLEANQRKSEVRQRIEDGTLRAVYPGFSESAWPAIAESVNQLAAENFFQTIAIIDAARACMDAYDVRLVIVPQDICRETKTLVLVAKERAVPSLHLLHGFPYGAINMHDDQYADVIAVYSERARKIYEGFGFPPDRIVVTGNPEWDIYMCPSTPGARAGFCSRLGLDPARPIVVYALTYTHELSAISVRHADYADRTTGAVLDAFAALEKQHSDWQFVLRPHPNDPRAPLDLPHRARLAGMEHIVIDTLLPAYGSAVIADCMVCSQSNIGIEAMFLGKPVVNVVIEEFGGPVFHEGMGPLFLDDDAVSHVDCAEGIVDAILKGVARKDGVTRSQRLESIRRFNMSADGRATGRFVELVVSMCEKG